VPRVLARLGAEVTELLLTANPARLLALRRPA